MGYCVNKSLILVSSVSVPGPAIGSYLYQLGGFGLPFFFAGSLAVVWGVCLMFTLPNVKQVQLEHCTFKAVNFLSMYCI